MLWSKAIIRTEKTPDFTSAEFRRAFLEKFDAYPEEVVFEENKVEINFPWETIMAPHHGDLMQSALKKITFKKISNGIEVSSTYQPIVQLVNICAALFLTNLFLRVVFYEGLVGAWPIIVFLLAAIVLPWYFVKRSPVSRFKKLLKSFS